MTKAGFLYPGDLANRILERGSFREPDLLAEVDIPERAELTQLLAHMYHASFGHEEGRHSPARIAYVTDTQLNSVIQSDESDLRLVKFKDPRPYKFSEILKLAPAVNPKQAMILVQADTSQSELVISGIAHVGSSTWQVDEGVRSWGTLPPSWLGVSSEAPGRLVVSVAGVRWMTLAEGQIELLQEDLDTSGLPRGNAIAGANGVVEDVLAHGVVVSYFDKELNSLSNDAEDAAQRLGLHAARVAPDVISGDVRWLLKRVINGIESVRHGGTLCFGWQADSLNNLARLKYDCNSNILRDALCRYVGVKASQDAHRLSGSGSGSYEVVMSNAVESSQLALNDAVQFLVGLTQVDGAVMLSPGFEVQGFGAQIRGEDPPEVRASTRADGQPTAQAIDLHEKGMRHRSAYRFCAASPHHLAIVCSQDGSSTLVKQVDDKLTQWGAISSSWRSFV